MSVLCHLIFLHPLMPLNHWPAACVEVASLHVLFHSGKGPYTYRKYLSCWSYQCFWTKHELLFLYQCPAYIVHNTTCLVCWCNIKIKRNFDGIVSGTMTWTLEPFSISMSICWSGYAMFVVLGLIMCSLLSSKALDILCSAIGFNYPLILMVFI